MAVTREHIVFSYPPNQEWTPTYAVDFMRRLEGYLQRIEQRVEALQDAMAALEVRVRALEPP